MLFALMSILSLAGFAFAPDKGAGGGASNPGDATAGSNSGEKGSADNEGKASDNTQNESGEKTASESDEGVRTMPAKAFNARLEQERRAGVRELLKTLGFEAETPEALEQAQSDMSELVSFARTQREEQMTVEERAKEAVTKAQQAAQTATAEVARLTGELDKAKSDLRSFVINQTITQAVSQVPHPEDVVAWALRNKPDLVSQIVSDEVPLFEDGAFNKLAINHEAVKSIVTDCMKERREWFTGRHPGVPSNSGAQPQPVDPKIAEKTKMADSLIQF